MYLHTKTKKVKQGYLLTDIEGEWHFKPGRIKKIKTSSYLATKFHRTHRHSGRLQTTMSRMVRISKQLTINRQFEDPKIFHVRRVRLAK